MVCFLEPTNCLSGEQCHLSWLPLSSQEATYMPRVFGCLYHLWFQLKYLITGYRIYHLHTINQLLHLEGQEHQLLIGLTWTNKNQGQQVQPSIVSFSPTLSLSLTLTPRHTFPVWVTRWIVQHVKCHSLSLVDSEAVAGMATLCSFLYRFYLPSPSDTLR